jgi:hypothetical protein
VSDQAVDAMTKAIALVLAIIVFVVAGLHIPPGGAWSANYVYQFGAAIVILRILGPMGKKFRLWLWGFDPDEELAARWRNAWHRWRRRK